MHTCNAYSAGVCRDKILATKQPASQAECAGVSARYHAPKGVTRSALCVFAVLLAPGVACS